MNPYNPETEAKKLQSYIRKVFQIECHFCGMDQEVDLEQDCSVEGAAMHLRDGGWREVTSQQYATIAAACPECVKGGAL